MSSRRVASSLSAILSLGLIVAVVFAISDQARQSPRVAPTAVPAVDETKSDPVQAQPKLAATKPVVLPPPPALKPTPAPKPAPASKPAQASKPAPAPKPAPRTEVALERNAPRLPASKPKPPAAQRPRPVETVKPPPAPRAKVAAPRPLKPKVKPKAAEKPLRQASKKKSDRPARSAQASSAASDAPAQPSGETVTATKLDVAEGRTLLRLLEFGSGPSVELAWPDAAAHRETLFTALGRCFGMQVALMDAQGRLFIAEGGPDRPWNLNLDRFSGFIREPTGQLSRQERRVVDRIRAHHRGLVSAAPVRVFPRTVDARLLGGLRRLLGGGYARARAIRAHYRIDGRRLLVERIVADGRAVQGTLEVPPLAGGGCRRLA